MGPEADVDVIGFGALNLDVIYRLPSVSIVGLEPDSETVGEPEGIEALVRTIKGVGGVEASVSAGGSAANTVFALARMGFSTGFVGSVGDDHAASLLVEGLGRPDMLSLKRMGYSGTTVIAAGEAGDRSIVVFPGANDELAPGDVDHILVARTRILHLTSFVGDSPLEAQLEVVRRLPQDITLSFDPGSLYTTHRRNAIGPILERADIVHLNEGELRSLTYEDRVPDGAQRLLEMGTANVVVKRGPRGIHTFWEDGEYDLRSQPVEVTGDSVGAGDVADAGYLAGYLLGRSHEQCTRLAHACAVRSLAGHGRDTYPDKQFLHEVIGGGMS